MSEKQKKFDDLMMRVKPALAGGFLFAAYNTPNPNGVNGKGDRVLKFYDRERFTWLDFFIIVACLGLLVWLGGLSPTLRRYWPTTIRVDTDMDSSWLQDEERTCQAYPDGEGNISVVACNPSGSHRDHNIPVTFWGDPDTYIVNKCRCRKENSILGNEFACRATE